MWRRLWQEGRASVSDGLCGRDGGDGGQLGKSGGHGGQDGGSVASAAGSLVPAPLQHYRHLPRCAPSRLPGANLTHPFPSVRFNSSSSVLSKHSHCILTVWRMLWKEGVSCRCFARLAGERSAEPCGLSSPQLVSKRFLKVRMVCEGASCWRWTTAASTSRCRRRARAPYSANGRIAPSCRSTTARNARGSSNPCCQAT